MQICLEDDFDHTFMAYIFYYEPLNEFVHRVNDLHKLNVVLKRNCSYSNYLYRSILILFWKCS